jgi:hypothetical protein
MKKLIFTFQLCPSFFPLCYLWIWASFSIFDPAAVFFVARLRIFLPAAESRTGFHSHRRRWSILSHPPGSLVFEFFCPRDRCPFWVRRGLILSLIFLLPLKACLFRSFVCRSVLIFSPVRPSILFPLAFLRCERRFRSRAPPTQAKNDSLVFCFSRSLQSVMAGGSRWDFGRHSARSIFGSFPRFCAKASPTGAGVSLLVLPVPPWSLKTWFFGLVLGAGDLGPVASLFSFVVVASWFVQSTSRSSQVRAGANLRAWFSTHFPAHFSLFSRIRSLLHVERRQLPLRSIWWVRSVHMRYLMKCAWEILLICSWLS